MIWLHETWIWKRTKTTLHGYHWFYIIHKTEDIYVEIAKDVETKFDISDYELDKPLPRGKNKTVIGLMKDILDGKMMTESAAFRPKACGCLNWLWWWEYTNKRHKSVS